MRSLALALALLATAAPAFAQSPAPAPAQNQAPAAGQNQAERFQAYLQMNGYKNLLGKLANIGDTLSAPECKDHKLVSHTIVAIFAPPNFVEGLHPVAGQWLDRVVMNRCGTEVFQNVAFKAQPNGQPPLTALLMPGATATIPPKQDQVTADILAAMAKNKCSDQTQIVPVNTKRDKETKALKVDGKGKVLEGAWKEIWTFRACGKTVNATVELSADGKGGLAHKVKL